MSSRNRFAPYFAAVGMLMLILDGQTALSGARDGVHLCLETLIPSLFPFFVLSVLLTGNLIGQPIAFLRPVGHICKIPKGCESLLAVGLLGGYPVGAQSVAFSAQRGQLRVQDASRLIAFCNNAGPAFLFGMIGPAFSSPLAPWLLWAIHMLSAVAVGMILPSPSSDGKTSPEENPVGISEALERSIDVMARVCGWVILFRILISFLNRWVLFTVGQDVRIFLWGLLELSNGCVHLAEIECEGLRFIAASVLLALGGLCVFIQTATVSKGVSMALYFPGKMLQSGISSLLAVLSQHLITRDVFPFPPVGAAMAALVCIVSVSILRRSKKRCSIPTLFGV